MANIKFKSVTQMCQYLIEKYMKLEGDTVKDVVFDEDNNTITVKYNDPEKADVTFAVGVPQKVLDDITDLQNDKQDKLTAGANITITQVGDDLVISSTGGGSDNAVEKSVSGTNKTSTIERTMSGSEPINLIAKLKYVLSAMYPNIGCHSTIKQGGNTLSDANKIAVVIDSQSTQYSETANTDRLVATATDKDVNININGGKYIKTIKTDSSPELSEKFEINSNKHNTTTDFTSSNPIKEEYELSKTEDVTIGGNTVTLNEKDKITRTINVSSISPDVPLNDEQEVKMEVTNEDLSLNGHYTATISKKVRQLILNFKANNPIANLNYDKTLTIEARNDDIYINNKALNSILNGGGVSPSNLKTRACKMYDTASGDTLMFNISYDSHTYDLISDSGNILTIINGMKMLGKKISNGVITDVLILFDSHENEFYTYNLTAPNTKVDTYNYNLVYISVVA